MSAMATPASPLRTIAPVAVLVALGAGTLGILAHVLGIRLVLALGGLAVTVAVVYRPFLGVLLLIATLPLENTLILQSNLTATRLLGLVVLGAWLIHKITRRESWGPVFDSTLVWAAAVFWILALASTLWARFPSVSIAGANQLLRLVALAVLLLDLVDSWTRCDRVAKAVVLGGTIAALLTIHQASQPGVHRAGGDIAGGVNGTAIVLVTVLPFAFYLLHAPQRSVWRAIGIIYVVSAAIAVLLTYSRMNLLLLPLVLGWLVWRTIDDRRARVRLLALAGAAAVAYLQFIPSERLVERIRSIGPYISATLGNGPADPNTSPRAYHMRVGIAIARDHPFVGAGYGNYGRLFRDQYQYRVAGGQELYRTPRSPHSSHIGILADLGLVGLCVWLSLLGIGWVNAHRARRRTHGDRSLRAHAFSQAVLVALVLHASVYGIYFPNQREKITWLILGLSAAVWRLAVADSMARQRPARDHRGFDDGTPQLPSPTANRLAAASSTGAA